jgi:hypothetical protein
MTPTPSFQGIGQFGIRSKGLSRESKESISRESEFERIESEVKIGGIEPGFGKIESGVEIGGINLGVDKI